SSDGATRTTSSSPQRPPTSGPGRGRSWHRASERRVRPPPGGRDAAHVLRRCRGGRPRRRVRAAGDRGATLAVSPSGASSRAAAGGGAATSTGGAGPDPAGEPIQAGFDAITDQSAANAALGAQSLGPREEKGFAATMVAWVNGHGGMGRDAKLCPRSTR